MGISEEYIVEPECWVDKRNLNPRFTCDKPLIFFDYFDFDAGSELSHNLESQEDMWMDLIASLLTLSPVQPPEVHSLLLSGSHYNVHPVCHELEVVTLE